MKNSNNKSEHSDLRQKAEELLKKKTSETKLQLSDIESLKLLHELEVHQIELELQNEELVMAKEQAETALEKYIELYDFAPAGYFTLSRKCGIIDLNFAGAGMLGKERSFLKNTSFCFYISDETKEDFVKFFEKVIQGNIGESCDISVDPYSSNSGYIHLTGIAAKDLDQCLITAVDITERKLAEEKIKSLLAEKELLLKEVHHRVKNNMYSVKNLLILHAESLNDPVAVNALQDAESRVQCMMVIYDKLYRSDNFKKGSIKDYLPSLIEEITGNFPGRNKIKTDMQIDDFNLEVNILINIGIIVNELLTNIMKYAFAGRDTGTISLTASLNNNHVVITIGDDGTGIPESVDLQNSTGFGLNLVRMITEQIGGIIRIERVKGTKFIIEFDI